MFLSCAADTELGHWVTGSMGRLGHLLLPGHWVIILTWYETRVFSSFRKNAQNAKRTFEMLAPDINTLTYLLTSSRLEYSIRYSTEYSSSKKLDSHTPTHKSTFGVHYRTGSPGQLGLRVAGFPGHWVAGSQNAGVKLGGGILPDLRSGNSYLGSTTSNNRSFISQLRSGTFLLRSTTLLGRTQASNTI